MKSVLYITSNSIWSGSEELWARSAKDFINKGYAVAFASRFEHPELDELSAAHVNFAERGGVLRLIKKGLQRYAPFKFEKHAVLKRFIKQINPQLIVISQGNPMQAVEVMEYCSAQRIPYVTITQLASDLFIWSMVERNLSVLQKAYLNARRNYFVSHHNLQVHNTMIGLELPNAEVVYNPCKILSSEVPAYPEPAGMWSIGLVGRVDCWHKGYDFLLQIANKPQWRERPVRFNLYGSGPYLDYMKDLVAQWQLSNVVFKGHSNNISQVWGENQILFMPSRMEGQALALIEAMFCQRAAIVTNVGGAAELIEEGRSGFIAELPAVACVDAALERAWQQRDRWKEMGMEAASVLKEKHPADAIAYFNERIEGELQAILPGKSSKNVGAAVV